MIIIGGGGAGLFLAEKIANSNKYSEETHKIRVIEEHNSLGKPVQCTGILTDEINSLLPQKEIRKFSLNKITSTRIFSPDYKTDIKIKPNIIIDNVKFVELLGERAEKSGTEILTGHRYVSNKGKNIQIKKISDGKIKSLNDSFIVGADGPRSIVASQNSLNTERKYLIGMQARMKIKDLEKNRIDFYPYIGEYAWSVPESEEISRVGVAVPLSEKNGKNNFPKKLFDDFLKKYKGKKLNTQAGLIPLHIPRAKIQTIKKDFSVSLLGDAAAQIKNTTGGGIIPGMKAALALSEGAESYRKKLSKLNTELYLHFLLNKSLRKYNHKDWNRLVLKADNPDVKKALENTNRDNAAKLLLSLATKKGMISEGIIAAGKLL